MTVTKKKLAYAALLVGLTIIIILIAILAIRIFSTAGVMIGFQATTNCTDTDGGKFPNIYGICADASRSNNYDSCTTLGVMQIPGVQEWYCEDNRCKFEIIPCEERYSCVAGECVKTI